MEHLKLASRLLSDNPLLSDKITKATGLKESETILVEVLRYLELVYLSGERLTPSHKVDLAWHEFILFTKQYADFCSKHFNCFIHHYPGDNHSENKMAFKKLHYHYQKHFGIKPNPEFWGKILVEIADESDCGTELI
jgi:hypothetical protein